MASTIQSFLSTNSVDYRRPTIYTVISFPLNGSENEFAFEAEKPEYKLHVLQIYMYMCHTRERRETETSSANTNKPSQHVERSVKVTKHGTIRYVRYAFLC